MDGEMMCFIAHTTKYFMLFGSAQVRPHILVRAQQSGMAVNTGFFCWLRLVVWRGGEQLGRDICGQEPSPSAGSVLCPSPIWAGPGGPCQSWGLCQVLHTLGRRRWPILVIQESFLVIFFNTWAESGHFWCHLWKHKGLNSVAGKKIQIPLSSACSQSFKIELL